MPIGKVWLYWPFSSTSDYANRQMDLTPPQWYQNNVDDSVSYWKAIYSYYAGARASFNADRMMIWMPFGYDSNYDGVYLALDSGLKCREHQNCRQFTYERDFIEVINLLANEYGGNKPAVYLGACGGIDDNILVYNNPQVGTEPSTALWRSLNAAQALQRIIRSLRPVLYAGAPVIIDTAGNRGSYEELHINLVMLLRNFGLKTGYEPRPQIPWLPDLGSYNQYCVVTSWFHRFVNETGSMNNDNSIWVPRSRITDEYIIIPSEAKDTPPTRTILSTDGTDKIHDKNDVLGNLTCDVTFTGILIATSDYTNFNGNQQVFVGDTIRIYTTYPTVYQEFKVRSVLADSSLQLVGSTFNTAAGSRFEIRRERSFIGSFNSTTLSILSPATTNFFALTSDVLDINAGNNIRRGDLVRYQYFYNGSNQVLNGSDQHIYTGSIKISSYNHGRQLTLQSPVSRGVNEKFEVVRPTANEKLHWLADGLSVCVGTFFSGMYGATPPFSTVNSPELRNSAAWWKATASQYPNHSLNFPVT